MKAIIDTLKGFRSNQYGQRGKGPSSRRRGYKKPENDYRVAMMWRCSDSFKIVCWNGQRVRVAFTMDCCDREIMGYVVTTGGISVDMIRDLMADPFIKTSQRDYVHINSITGCQDRHGTVTYVL